MIFIIGGQAQGKTEAAGRLCRDEKTPVADGRTSDYEEALSAGLVLHLECYVMRLLQEGKDPAVFAMELMEKNETAVVTADEIGCGIVPADAFTREYRETAGRICQKIALFSEEVYRIVCGLAIRIK